MQAVAKALYVVERTREIGRMTVASLAETPGWDKASASRYLAFLSKAGWLERVNEKGYPIYVLGRKLLSLPPELHFPASCGETKRSVQ